MGQLEFSWSGLGSSRWFCQSQLGSLLPLVSFSWSPEPAGCSRNAFFQGVRGRAQSFMSHLRTAHRSKQATCWPQSHGVKEEIHFDLVRRNRQVLWKRCRYREWWKLGAIEAVYHKPGKGNKFYSKLECCERSKNQISWWKTWVLGVKTRADAASTDNEASVFFSSGLYKAIGERSHTAKQVFYLAETNTVLYIHFTDEGKKDTKPLKIG